MGQSQEHFGGLISILRDKGEDRPPLVMLENVVGFLMSDDGRDFEAALLALCELGYSVDALIINASSFVPQSRARLFVITKRYDDGDRVANAAISDVRPEPLATFINLNPHIRWDIQELPRLPQKTRLEGDYSGFA